MFACRERIRISQNSTELQAKELAGLHKRNQQLQDAVSKAEIATYHANDQLIAARGIAERLRNETAGLRAENELFKVRRLSAQLLICFIQRI